MATTLDPVAVGEKGRKIYAEIIRPQLTEKDKGNYVFIHTETGEWIMGDDDGETSRRASDKWGTGQPIYEMRAGYRSTASFCPGLDLEIKNW